MKYNEKKNSPFLILTIGIMLLLTLPRLVQDGMFLDGMLYTSVSHNLGNGIGSIWQPVFSPFYNNAGSSFFHEHPPLVFGIQSLFYKLLGDSMYVERLYIFLTMCLTAFLINHLWKSIYKDNDQLKNFGWLAILFWIIIPSCYWSYGNNMMENTMGLFDLCAVIFIFKARDSEKFSLQLQLLAGLFIFFATFSKGVPGFFPLAVPFLYWLIFRKGSVRRPLLQTFIISSIPIIFYFILFQLPESRESLNFYVTARLLQRIHDQPTVTGRLYIIKRLFSELIPLFLIAAIIFGTLRYKKIEIKYIFSPRYIALFFLTGLAATAPLTLTMVQRGFYLVPGFPYFGIAFAMLLAPSVLYLLDKLSDSGKLRIFKLFGIAVLIFTLVFSAFQKGKTYRDKDMLHDVHLIGKTIPSGSAITINQDLVQDYSLECYFIRYYQIGLHIDVPEKYLIMKKIHSNPDTINYRKVDIQTSIYDLYQRK